MKSLLRQSLLVLCRKKVPQAHNSIAILKDECFKKDSIKVWARNISKFQRLVKLRSWHYPVQYLCSSWPFRQLQLKLNKPVLIPRFQSQYMIQILANRIDQKYDKNEITKLEFVQYGCGSGALGLSLAKQLKMKGTLIDIKNYCIKLSTLNARKNNIDQKSLTFIQADMMDKLDLVLDYDIIVSNPPYLSKEHYLKYLKTQIKKYQDIDALITDKNGMKYVEALTNIWKNRIKPGIMMIQFDGRTLDGDLEWLEPFVIKDQYEKRRFILLEK